MGLLTRSAGEFFVMNKLMLGLSCQKQISYTVVPRRNEETPNMRRELKSIEAKFERPDTGIQMFGWHKRQRKLNFSQLKLPQFKKNVAKSNTMND